MTPDDPLMVILTEDFLDLLGGVGFPEGTVLVRYPTGQYAPLHTRLGKPCVTSFKLIKDICQPHPTP